jgi:hypothetical protein
MKKAFKETRSLETYSIKVVMDKRDDLNRFPNITPRATDITELEVLRDLHYSFGHLADKLGGSVEITRTHHLWCESCDAYVGNFEMKFVEYRYDRTKHIINDDTLEYRVNTYECLACGHVSRREFSPVICTM